MSVWVESGWSGREGRSEASDVIPQARRGTEQSDGLCHARPLDESLRPGNKIKVRARENFMTTKYCDPRAVLLLSALQFATACSSGSAAAPAAAGSSGAGGGTQEAGAGGTATGAGGSATMVGGGNSGGSGATAPGVIVGDGKPFVPDDIKYVLVDEIGRAHV